MKSKNEAIKDFNENLTIKNSNQIKAKYLGSKSQITSFKKYMKDLKPEDKPSLGKIINEIQADIEAVFNSKLKELKTEELNKKLLLKKLM